MIASMGTGLGFGETKNPQTYIYTSSAATIAGKNKFVPPAEPKTWSPGPGNHRVEKDAIENDAPKFK